MEKILALYEYVDGVNDTPFPNSDEQVFIGSFTYNAVRMGGAPSITATVKHSLCLDNLWSRDVYAEFDGEKYFVINTPSSSKSNDDSRYEHSVELLSERDVLNHVYFIDAVQEDSSIDKYKSNSTNILFVGDIHEFAGRIADAIAYSGLDYTVVVDNGITSEEKTVSFEDKKILEALQEIYNIFEIPYYFVGKTIHIGYTENAIPNVMKYGDSEALLSVSKENANYEAINRITGTGSPDNIPYYYPNMTPDGDMSIEVNPTSTGISAGDVIITNGLALSEVSSSDDFTYMECKTKIPDSDGNAESQCRVTASRFYTHTDSSTDMEKVAESTTGLLTSLPMRMEHPFGGYVSFASNRLEIDVKVDKPCTIHWQPNFQETVTVSGQTLTNRTTRYYYRTQSGTQYNINNYTFNVGQSAIGTITLCCEIAYATQYATTDAIEYDYTLLLTHALDYQGNGWTLDGDNSVFLSDYGLTLKQDVSPNEGDSFHKLIVRTNPIVQNLMPSIYRESDGAERFYNAKNNTYKNEGGDYYEFENEYSVNNIREGITDFPDIMPTITGIVNASGQRIDRFVAFAYDINDNNELNEEGEYIHPFFFAKLRKMDGDHGFNLFDHAIEQQSMQISMTSGACGACTFEIAVGDETQKNLVQVDENGNLLRDDNGYVLCGREDLQQPQTPQSRQNDTQNYEVWIALRKDNTTYPELMPNGTLKPTTNDTFVILGIRLPQGYITAAEQRLTDSLIKYMWENNKEKFTFSIKFSRIYFEENPDVLALLNENARLVVEYNNQQHTLYVEDFSYKMESDSPLPEITVTLADTLAVGQNSLQTQLDSVKQDILSSVGGGDFLRQGLKYFIRKDISDYAKGLITFRKGAIFGNNGFAQGLAGFGGKIDNLGNGELESLVLRRFLEVPELRYNRVEVFVGDKWRSPGAGVIESVEITSDNTGIIALHLEDGEIGAVAVDDICMGIFHDYKTLGNNSADDYDDGCGNRRFAGFCTVYFRITEILDVGNNGRFRYSLRSVDDGWNRQFHPLSAMHFVAYGNFTNVGRQCSVYETRTYTRMLVKQNTWEISSVNVAMQWGDLSNLNVFGLEMSGYSAYLNNIYMSGTIDQTVNDPYRIEVSLSSAGQFVNYGETVTVKCKVFQGWTDKTAGVASWEITRDSGDTASDATWNASSKAQSFANTGEITLAYTKAVNDMGGNFATDGTLFDMSATLQDGTSVSTQLLLRAYPAASGVTRYWLVIDRNVVNATLGTTNVTIQTMKQTGNNDAIPTTDGSLTIKYFDLFGSAGEETSLTNTSGVVVLEYNPLSYSHAEVRYYINGEVVDIIGVVTVKDGEDGADGEEGQPGKSLYTWIRYADDAQGGGLSDNPTGKAFIGLAYNKESPVESLDPSDYTWSDIKGEDGVPGAAGEDGKTYYTWIAYSDYPDGSNMYQQPTDNTLYIGIATNKETATESNNPADYTWSRFRGADGTSFNLKGSKNSPDDLPLTENEIGDAYLIDGDLWVWDGVEWNNAGNIQGPQGPQGEQGVPGTDGKTTYFHIKYSANSNGYPMSETPNVYIGTYVDFTAQDSSDYTDYTWSRFQGLQGEQGIPGTSGVDGKTYYLHIKYSDDGGTTFTSNNGETPGSYIGVLTDLNAKDSTDPSDYTWSKIKGEDGADGEPGNPGEDAMRYWLVVEPNSINIDEISGDNVDITASMMEQMGQNEPTLSDSGVFAAMNLIMGGMEMPPILRDASAANPTVFSISKSNMGKISKINIGLYKGTNIDNGVLLDYVDITLTRNGVDGEDAVTYDLIPSVGQINKSELTGSADDRIILEAYKITGSNRSDNLFDLQGSMSPPTDYKAQYSIDGGNWTDCEVTYNGHTYLYGVNYEIVNQVVSSLGLRLCDSDGNVLKTIPALKTVSDGVGSISYWITADPEVVVFSPDAPSLTEVIPVTLTCWKQVGSDAPSVFTDGVLKVVYDSGTENELILSGNSYSLQFTMLAGILPIRHATATLYVDDVPVASKVVSVDETAPESSLLLRMSEWVSGVEYHDDTNFLYSTSGQKWLDIAVITKSATSFDAYRCKQTHTASTSNKPGSGANWQTYWEKFNEMAPIYTPLIMAQNALLRFTQTNQLLVMKSDGTTVAAGLGGGHYPIWVGSPNADNAPFKVDINGKLFSTNAEIAGNIIAVGGRFLGGVGNPYTDFDLQGTVKFPSLQELIDGRNIRVVGSTANGAGIMLPVNIGTEQRYDGVEFIIRNDTDDFLVSHPGNLVPRIRMNGLSMASVRLKQNTSVRFKIFTDGSIADGGLCYEIMNPSCFYIMPSGILENGEIANIAVSKNTKYYPANQSLQVVFNAWNAGNNAQATFYADSNYNGIDKWGPFYLSKAVWYNNYMDTYNTNIPCHNYWFGLEDGKMRELPGFDIKFVNIRYYRVLSSHAQPKIVLKMYRGQRLFLMVSNPDSDVGGLVMAGDDTGSGISVKKGKLYEFVYYDTLHCLNSD